MILPVNPDNPRLKVVQLTTDGVTKNVLLGIKGGAEDAELVLYTPDEDSFSGWDQKIFEIPNFGPFPFPGAPIRHFDAFTDGDIIHVLVQMELGTNGEGITLLYRLTADGLEAAAVSDLVIQAFIKSSTTVQDVFVATDRHDHNFIHVYNQTPGEFPTFWVISQIGGTWDVSWREQFDPNLPGSNFFAILPGSVVSCRDLLGMHVRGRFQYFFN